MCTFMSHCMPISMIYCHTFSTAIGFIMYNYIVCNTFYPMWYTNGLRMLIEVFYFMWNIINSEAFYVMWICDWSILFHIYCDWVLSSWFNVNCDWLYLINVKCDQVYLFYAKCDLVVVYPSWNTCLLMLQSSLIQNSCLKYSR